MNTQTGEQCPPAKRPRGRVAKKESLIVDARFTIGLPRGRRAELVNMAESEGLDVSAFVRRIVLRYLNSVVSK